MKDLIDKLSSYNLFNYLLPGVLFAVIADNTTGYSLIQDDLILGLFLYYFVGLVISRFGSVVLEPLLRQAAILKYASYADFLKASAKDSKIELLSESNNMYRTIVSMFTLILMLKGYDSIPGVSSEADFWFMTCILLLLFLLSYRKQTAYITNRVRSKIDQDE